jgi:flavorubredoxin
MISMKIVIIYDSETGNTKKMAEAIGKGAAKTAGEVQVKKIGDAFPLSILAESEGVLFGSPVIYADVSNEMKDFLDHVESYIKAGKIDTSNVTAGVFGSYGWDGAWIMEERLKSRVELLGFKVYDSVCVTTDNDIKYQEETLVQCEKFGIQFAKSI